MKNNESFLVETGPKRFFCRVQEKIEGPLDVIELAAHIKYRNIDGDTLVCREGTDTYLPFRDLPEYTIAQEVSIEEIARHLHEKERSPASSALPGPAASPWSFNGIVGILCLVIAATALSYYYLQTPGPKPENTPNDGKDPHFVFSRQYRAVMDVTTKNHDGTNTVYHDNGKIRMEINRLKGSVIFIFLPDRHTIYLIMPAQRVVIPSPYDAKSMGQEAIGPDSKYEYLGTEVIDDVPNAKYRVSVDKYSWLLFVDANLKVPLRMESQNASAKSVSKYKSYQPGPQDPSLFEAPGEYKWLNL